MMPVSFQFDAFVMVDWSANNGPKSGKDSIWYCVLERVNGVNEICALENPSTRRAAYEEIRETLKRLAKRGVSTLVGFDFAYGYPRGFAQALKIRAGERWKEVWALLLSRIVDSEENRSNRFEAAAALNAEMSGQPFPFWGCPANQEREFLKARRFLAGAYNVVPEFRFTDRRIRGPQSVWKLCYPGSVGSQALVGIPYFWRLRFEPELVDVSRVWPFETGFGLAARDQRGWGILHAEIYPPAGRWDQGEGECKDKAQVRGLAEYFADEDAAGRLAGLFAAPEGFSEEQLGQIVGEEGWILGVR